MHDYTILLNEIKKLDPNYQLCFWPQSGNFGDALIAYASYQFLRANNIKYISGQNLDYSKKYNLIHGGGGGFVPYWSYARQLPKCLTHRNLNKCIVMPQSLFECEFFLKIADERFSIFCREKQSYDYCIKNNRRAKFFLCDDMAFYANLSYLNDISFSNDTKFVDLKKRIDSYHAQNPNRIANFIRNDKEKTVQPTVSPIRNLDLSSLVFEPASGMTLENVKLLVKYFMYAIDKYDTIITNRLHVAIGAYLLNKKIELYDNSYHKVKNVYEMSMQDKKDLITTCF